MIIRKMQVNMLGNSHIEDDGAGDNDNDDMTDNEPDERR